MYSFEELKLLYEWGIVDAAVLDQAVTAGWITQEDRDVIIQRQEG